MAVTLQWLEEQPLPDAEGSDIGFDTGLLCLPPFLDTTSVTARRGGDIRGPAVDSGSSVPIRCSRPEIMKI